MAWKGVEMEGITPTMVRKIEANLPKDAMYQRSELYEDIHKRGTKNGKLKKRLRVFYKLNDKDYSFTMPSSSGGTLKGQKNVWMPKEEREA